MNVPINYARNIVLKSEITKYFDGERNEVMYDP